MDALRSVKDQEEIELMTRAQQIATLGMDHAREWLRPGVTAQLPGSFDSVWPEWLVDCTKPVAQPEVMVPALRADAQRYRQRALHQPY